MLSGAEAEALAAVHGTPFYFYDLDAAAARLAALRAGLPPHVELFYAVKANGNKRVLEGLRPHLDGLDVSSAGEIDLALAAGYVAEQLSFAGPGKTAAELARAVDAGLGVLSVESLGELARLPASARQRITLRINPADTPREFAMRMGGGPSAFGVAEEDADAAVQAILADPRLRLDGFHIYAGTQCLDVPALAANVRGSLAIAARLAERHGLSPSVVNLGGGFGVAYFAGQDELDLPALTAALSAELAAAPAALRQARFVFELGRFVMGPFGSYVSRVLEIKSTRGKRFAVLDGGMHHCFPATGNFGQLVKKNYPIANLSRGGEAGEPVELVGPLCTPMDTLGRGVRLDVREGDLVAIHAVGAYGFSASPLLFLGHDTPVELVHQDGVTTVARPRHPAHHFW